MINTTRRLIIQRLQKQPQSHRDLADAISVTVHCIRHNMHALRASGEVFISAWVRYGDRGPHMPVFSLGSAKDVVAPRPLSDAKRMRLWRKNNPAAVMNSVMHKRKARAALPKARTKQQKPEFWRM